MSKIILETKVIFLDVDGVLNKYSDYQVIESDGTTLKLNKELIERLKTIITDTGAYLVLSSSWRNTNGGIEFLEERGLTFLGVTDNENEPIGTQYRNWRGKQIQRWLDKNPNVTNYVILDDDGDMLQNQLPHFIQTDPDYGLTETLAYRATYILKHGTRYGETFT